MKDAQKPEDRESLRVHLNLSLNERDQVEDALEAAEYHCGDAASILNLLGSALASGAFDGRDAAVGTLLLHLSESFARLSERDGVTLGKFALKFRSAVRDDWELINEDQKEATA